MQAPGLSLLQASKTVPPDASNTTVANSSSTPSTHSPQQPRVLLSGAATIFTYCPPQELMFALARQLPASSELLNDTSASFYTAQPGVCARGVACANATNAFLFNRLALQGVAWGPGRIVPGNYAFTLIDSSTRPRCACSSCPRTA